LNKKVLYDIAARHYHLYLDQIVRVFTSQSGHMRVSLSTEEQQDLFLHMLTHLKKKYAHNIPTNEGMNSIVAHSVHHSNLSENFNFMLKLARIDPTYEEYADESIQHRIAHALITPAKNDTQG